MKSCTCVLVLAAALMGEAQQPGSPLPPISPDTSVTASMPVVMTVTPAKAIQGAKNLVLTVTGMNFTSGAMVEISDAGVAVESTAFVSPTELRAKVSVSLGAPVGARDVTVKNANGVKGIKAGAFMVSVPISGKVILKGNPPKRKRIRTDADPVCSDIHKNDPLLTEEVVTKEVGGENRLQWAFVYVKNIDKKYDPPKEPAKIDQNGCHYVPHVQGVLVNQEIMILNSDPTLHNIHAMPKSNKEFNFGQAKKGMEEIKKFNTPELPVPIKCDVHPWMAAYVFVLPHPFFGTTGEDGTYTIKDLPSGEYEVVAWHEKFGEQTTKVKIEDGKPADNVNFTFELK